MSQDKVSQLNGLTSSQVDESRRQHGTNVLTPPAREPWWVKFGEKLTDPLIIILEVAGLMSVFISCYEYWGLHEGASVFMEPAGIFMAILLATGLAFYFEQKAAREFALLNQVNDDEPVQVKRDGNMTSVPRRDIVVGDIVFLSTGNEIPADGQLHEAVSLNVDESTLTGEPMAHKTTVEADFDPDATFPSDTVLRGTKVMEGHGVMSVTAVGDNTENGKVFEAARIEDNVKTPLTEQLDRLSRFLSWFSYTVGALVVLARVGIYFSTQSFEVMGFITYLLQTVMIAVTLVVCSIPEGLPMAVTLALAFSMRRMLRTNNLVRKLHACETMGATTVICTDKTGTLTENRMTVAHTDFFGNPPLEVIADAIALNSTAELDLSDEMSGRLSTLGNPTEGALLQWLWKKGKDYRALRAAGRKVKELPFSTERKYMATVVADSNGRRVLFVKGAPEIVFGLCADTSGVTKAEIDATLSGYQAQAMRTLGFAYQELEDGDATIDDNRVVARRLKLLGIVAISDPVRDDVPAAVREVMDAGVQLKIVTGDTPGTAKEIGRQIGLWDDKVDGDRNIITGVEFANLSDDELLERVGEMKIIARARPLDKKRLVEALQKNGEVVAVTGDGTNDAPALKSAQVGLSMGDGTSVAKEASDITIVDNSFASIGRAVMWGRSLYRNIQRFIMFQMTVNFAACLIVLAGAFMGTESPLTVTQMLWVNLIMDTFAAVALSSLPPSADVMKEKPRRRSAFIISKAMYRSIIITGSLFFVFLVGLLYYLEHTPLESLTQVGHLDIGVNTGLTATELTIFFTTFVFLQFWNIFNARAFETRRTAFHFGGCSSFLTIAALIFVGQIAIVEIGGQFFNVTGLSFVNWVIIIGVTSLVLWIGELSRATRRGLDGKNQKI